MRVNVLFFAAARDAAGASGASLDLPAGSTLSDLQQKLISAYPSASALFSVCRFALDEEYVAAGQALVDGAQVCVIPPVSGGAGGEAVHVKIVRSPIDMYGLISRVAGGLCGACLTFAGTVREDDRSGRKVVRIEYEGYEPMAEKVLRKIAAEAAARHAARVAVEHRLGTLAVGETSIGIAVASAHRAEGFEALRDIIEAVKRDLPIWKKEEFSDGTSEWADCRIHSKPLQK